MRTIASQMKDAEGQTITVRIDAQLGGSAPNRPELIAVLEPSASCAFAASGRTITFAGFLKAYVESIDEASDGQSDDAQTRLPQLTEGQPLRPEQVLASGHETRPPARYTEPSLVAKLEELEIGRPSTYESIIRTITSRDYVFKKGSALVPTWLAFAVTRLLEEHFSKLVDYAFTAEMEDVLDEIAGGNAERVSVLTDFYFGSDDREGLQRLVSEFGEIDARRLSTFELGDLEDAGPDGPGSWSGSGRYGTYVEDADRAPGQRGRRPAARRAHGRSGPRTAQQADGRGARAGHRSGDRTAGRGQERSLRALRHRGAAQRRPEEPQAPDGIAVRLDERRRRRPGAAPCG